MESEPRKPTHFMGSSKKDLGAMADKNRVKARFAMAKEHYEGNYDSA